LATCWCAHSRPEPHTSAELPPYHSRDGDDDDDSADEDEEMPDTVQDRRGDEENKDDANPRYAQNVGRATLRNYGSMRPEVTDGELRRRKQEMDKIDNDFSLGAYHHLQRHRLPCVCHG
jgi:hypothetical protein